jgi:hypothetical protein
MASPSFRLPRMNERLRRSTCARAATASSGVRSARWGTARKHHPDRVLELGQVLFCHGPSFCHELFDLGRDSLLSNHIFCGILHGGDARWEIKVRILVTCFRLSWTCHTAQMAAYPEFLSHLADKGCSKRVHCTGKCPLHETTPSYTVQ